MAIVSVLNVIRIFIIILLYGCITPATMHILWYKNIYKTNEIYLYKRDVNVL